MIILHTTQDKRLLINPLHIVLMREATSPYGDPYVEIYCGNEKIEVKEPFDEIQLMLHQFNKK